MFSSAVSLFDVAVPARTMVESTIAAEEIMSRGEKIASSPTESIMTDAPSATANVLSSRLPSFAALNRCFALRRVKGRPRVDCSNYTAR